MIIIFYLLISDSTGDRIGFRPLDLFKIWCVVEYFRMNMYDDMYGSMKS